MPLHNVFIFEGRYDAQFRAEAARKFAEFVDELRAHPELVLHTVQPGEIVVRAGKMSSLPSDLFLQFKFKAGKKMPTAEFAPTRSGGATLIEFTIYSDRARGNEIDELLASISGTRDAFIHEYTHYLDWKRIGHQAWSQMRYQRHGLEGEFTSAGQLRKYYQDPIEQNAMFQQAADDLTQRVTPELAKEMGINKFYRLFVKTLSTLTVGAPKMYRERQIPKLKKRVAQLYRDITSSG